MQKHNVNSSLIASIGHKDNTLHITFKKGGDYSYKGVSETEFNAMKSAPSVGQYFLANIKPKYPHTKL